jgi:PAS domain S-box-containing protein
MTSPSGKDHHGLAPVAEQVRTYPQHIPERSHGKSPLRLGWAFYPTQVALLAAVYFGAAKLGLTMAFVAEQVTAVWPPTGIALAALFFLGYRAWPGIALGAFLVNATANEPLGTVAGIALGNTLEALAGAWMLRRLVGFDRSMERVQDVLGLMVLGAGLSTMVSATIGVTSLCLGGVKPWTAYPEMWSVWWLGDAMGNLVVAPLLFTWAGWHRLTWHPRRVTEAGALLVALAAVSLLVFVGPTARFSFHPLAYTVFPFVIWAALRFGPPAATLMTFVASSVAIWGTVRGSGPFAAPTMHESLILLQVFMSVVAVTTLVLAAVTLERERAKGAARQSRDDLRQSHNLLRAVTEGTTDAVFVKDRQGRYVMINTAGARFLGETVAEVIGKDDTEVFSVETARTIMEADRRIMATGEIQTYEDVGTAAGVTRTYLSTKGPYRDAQGNIIGLIGISCDITERKRAEETRSRLAAIVESTDDAILSKDLDGIILTWNRAAETMYGYSPAEAVGKPISLLVPPERAGEVSAILEQLKRGEHIENHETVRLRKDGTRIEVSLNISPMPDAAGRVTGGSVIGRDITARKRAERRLTAEHAVTRALADSHNLEDAVPQFLQTIGETLACDLGLLWEVGPAPEVLRCVAVWHTPGIDVTEFEQHSRRLTFARGEGLPGRAWDSGQPAWVPEAPFPRSVAAQRTGPCGALAVPLRSDGNFLAVLEYFSPEFRQPQDAVLDMMASIGIQIGQFIERRRAEVLWHARAQEFRLAREIQQGLLPQTPPTLAGYAIAGASHPTQETGGDYFDFIHMSDGHLGICVGDASGHGIAAALLIAATRAYVRALALTHSDPGTILSLLDTRLAEDTSSRHFVTLLFARLCPRTRSLVYSNAGHWPGYVFDAQGEVKMVLQSTSFPLGVDPSGKLSNGPALTLDPGDLVFLLSDGIVEATSRAGSLFGVGRALEVVRAHRYEPPDEIIAALLDQVCEWSESVQLDDMTAIVIKVGGQGRLGGAF